MMVFPKPPTVRAQEIILAQMERLDKIAADMVKPDEEGEMTRPELYDMESLAKAMAELNRELYRTFPPLTLAQPFYYPQSAD